MRVLQASLQRTAVGEAGAASQEARRKLVNLRRLEPLPLDGVAEGGGVVWWFLLGGGGSGPGLAGRVGWVRFGGVDGQEWGAGLDDGTNTGNFCETL